MRAVISHWRRPLTKKKTCLNKRVHIVQDLVFLNSISFPTRKMRLAILLAACVAVATASIVLPYQASCEHRVSDNIDVLAFSAGEVTRDCAVTYAHVRNQLNRATFLGANDRPNVFVSYVFCVKTLASWTCGAAPLPPNVSMTTADVECDDGNPTGDNAFRPTTCALSYGLRYGDPTPAQQQLNREAAEDLAMSERWPDAADPRNYHFFKYVRHPELFAAFIPATPSTSPHTADPPPATASNGHVFGSGVLTVGPPGGKPVALDEVPDCPNLDAPPNDYMRFTEALKNPPPPPEPQPNAEADRWMHEYNAHIKFLREHTIAMGDELHPILCLTLDRDENGDAVITADLCDEDADLTATRDSPQDVSFFAVPIVALFLWVCSLAVHLVDAVAFAVLWCVVMLGNWVATPAGSLTTGFTLYLWFMWFVMNTPPNVMRNLCVTVAAYAAFAHVNIGVNDGVVCVFAYVLVMAIGLVGIFTCRPWVAGSQPAGPPPRPQPPCDTAHDEHILTEEHLVRCASCRSAVMEFSVAVMGLPGHPYGVAAVPVASAPAASE